EMEITEASEDRRCLVCETPITAMHFGMDACRACSSFFKRVKLSGKKYNCRRGDGKCTITGGGKVSCRQCRFDKCQAVGLAYDGPLRVNKKPQEESPDPVDPVTFPSTSTESFLDRIGREFNTSIDRRRVQERIFLEECDATARLPHPSEEMYFTSYATSLRTYDYTILETWQFFKAVFPNLQSLTLLEQKNLFALYLPKFSLMEAHFRTRKIWGSVGHYLMSSVLICVDLRNPDSWVGKEDGGVNRATLIQSIEQYTHEQCSLIVPIMNRAQLTNKEFHATLALLLCDSGDAEEMPSKITVLLDDIQVEVIEELQRYYKHEMGLSDFSTRLGNLMTLTHTMRECAALFQEFFRTQVALFDLYTAQEMFKELFI
ncbi:hypothetical protein PENTCL1PPCAC_12919, partial [Pristionchus entomophagus]